MMNKLQSFKNELLMAFKIRSMEMMLLKLYAEGFIDGTVHTCIGQELIGIFVAKNLNEEDFVFSNHRGHGHFVSLNKKFYELIAEVLSKKDGVCGGIGGSQHLISKNFLSNGIQGGLMPVAAGLAFANKEKNAISVIYIGDGTLGQGLVYETLNLASLWEAPLLVIIENNGIAQSNPTTNSIAGNICDRINSFDLEFRHCNVWDLESLDNIIIDATQYVRVNKKPCVVQIDCARLMAHSKGDDNRNPEEVEALKKRDLVNLAIESGLITKKEIDAIDMEIEEIAQRALKSETLVNATKFHPILNLPEKLLPFINPENLQTGADKINNALNYFLGQFTSAILIGEDIEDLPNGTHLNYGGAFKITKGLSSKYKERVKNTPISESAITGFALGYSLSLKPSIVEIMFGDFVTLCADQLIQNASKFKYMFGCNLDIPFILRTPMGGRRGYGPTHSQSIEKIFLGWPGLDIVALNIFSDVREIYQSICSANVRNPHVIIENKVLYLNKAVEMPYGYCHMISKNSIPTHVIKPINNKSALLVFCYGSTLTFCIELAKKLFLDHEIQIEIVCPEKISPLNMNQIIDSIKNKKGFIGIEEGSRVGSISSLVISELSQIGVLPNFCRLYSNDSIIPASRNAEESLMPSIDKIIDEIINEEFF
jgi:2-oxoisovalerate dehydrogenase E1 component